MAKVRCSPACPAAAAGIGGFTLARVPESTICYSFTFRFFTYHIAGWAVVW